MYRNSGFRARLIRVRPIRISRKHPTQTSRIRITPIPILRVRANRTMYWKMES